MPTSTWVHISDMMNTIVRMQPKSILDVGCGTGRWGFLCRELLDIGKRRWKREEWQVHITGVDASVEYREYFKDNHDYAYDFVSYLPIQSYLELHPKHTFNVTILGDVLEHMSKSEALGLIQTLSERTDVAILIGLPIGEWPQKNVNGNKFEDHVASWTVPELAKVCDCYKLYPSHNKVYALAARWTGMLNWVLKGFTPVKR